ncbi:MAG: hypothetical protein DMG39_17510, partial [Acidobacteria bacterium]
PEQLNITTLLNPPLGVTETVYVADCPGLTAAVPGLMDTEKSSGLVVAGDMDCNVCTKSNLPLPMPAPTGTAWATAAAALDSLVVGSTFSNRAPAPETNGALKDAIRQRRC